MISKELPPIKATPSHEYQKTTPKEDKAEVENKVFEDGFIKEMRHRVVYAKNLPTDFKNDLDRRSIKKHWSNEELLLNAKNAQDFDTITPTTCKKIAYETGETYVGPFDFGSGGIVDSITVINKDITKDADCPGRFFINSRTFLDDAANLYASDHEYLDNKHAWLPKDITRYAKDICNFFGCDSAQADEMAMQFEKYIRASGSGSNTSEIVIDINDVAISVNSFIDMAAALKDILSNAGASEAGMNETRNLIENYAKENLDANHSELLLSTQNHWDTYCKWASTYSHDANVFRYS